MEKEGCESAQLVLLKEINEAANRGEPLDDILQMAVEGMRKIFGYEACDLFLIEDEKTLNYSALDVDSKMKKAVEKLTGLSIKGRRIPLFEGSCFKEVLDSKRPLVLDDMVKVFEDFTDNKRLKKFAPAVAKIVGFKRVLRVPLFSNDRAIGVLGVATNKDIRGEDLRVLELFSSHLALVVERRWSEDDIKYLKEFNENIVEGTPFTIHAIDRNFIVRTWNKHCERYTNVKKEDIIDKNLFEVIPSLKGLGWEEIYRGVMESGEPYEKREYKVVRTFGPHKGEVLYQNINVVPLRLGEKIIGAITLLDDITEIKKTESELKAAYERLQAAYEELKSLDELKRGFLGSISHELRTPLNSIIGFTGLMLQGMAGDLSEEQMKQLGIVSSSGKHLLGLVEELLDISLIEAEKMEISPEKFHFGEVINEVVETFASDIQERGLEIHEDVGDEEIFTDRRRFRRVILNLIGNAVKFTPKGSITIRGFVDDGFLRVSVKDTGVGICKSDLPRLFKPFQPLQPPGERARDGFGLGLYWSKKIVSLLGGDLWLEEGCKEGSNFIFKLPVDMGSEIDSAK